MKPAVFHDQAKVEMDEAAAWYESCRAGLGRKFLSAVEEAVRRICENPQAGSIYGATRFRYVLVRRFPYILFYSDSEKAHTIKVMAVAHGRRKPGYWKNRKNG